MKRLPWTYYEALGFGGRKVNVQKAIEIIQRVGVTAVSDTSETPLSVAAMLGRAEMVKWLLGQGAEIDYVVPGSQEETPLHQACYQKQLACVKILVEAGANLEKGDRLGLTPLAKTFTHCFADPIPIAEYLLRRGALITERVYQIGCEWNEEKFKKSIKNVG